jgi:serine/threonine protein kinase
MARLKIGQVIKNRYRVDEYLGGGGMAEVYKVKDQTRGVHLAMKVLREDLAEDRVFLRRFQREAKNLASLQHTNIVRYYGLEQEGRSAFILMDYIEGTTLRGEIFDTKKPFSNQRVLDILEPVCNALHYAHQMGIVHCDVKPANIMIDKHGQVLLTDFGIARMADAATSTLVGVGTPAYMAPELIRGENPTPQTDIYALGIIMYEMLSGGERPFHGEKANTTGTTAEKVRWEHIHSKPPSIREYNPGISEQLETIITKCLEKVSRKRYNAISDLLNALEAACVEQKKDEIENATEVITKSNEIKPEKTHKPPLKVEKPEPISPHIEEKTTLILMDKDTSKEKPRKPAAEADKQEVKPAKSKEKSRSEEPTNGGSRFRFWVVGALAIALVLILAVILLGRQGNQQAIAMKVDQPVVVSAIAPDCKIAFTSDRDGNNEIYLMNADGSNVQRLTNNLTYDMFPAWSPDGSRIAFSSDRDGNLEIYLMNADGSNVQRLTKNSAEDVMAAWSPDGNKITFSSNRDGNFKIYSMNADGSNVKRLTNTNNSVKNSFSTWSPDGSKISFSSNQDGNLAIYSMNADGSNVQRLTNNPTGDGAPAWSPDGSKIAFTSERDGKWGVYVMNVNGSNVQRLTKNPTGDDVPAWSPDGSKITFTGKQDGNWEIYSMNADGSNVQRLTNNSVTDYLSAWSPLCK